MNRKKKEGKRRDYPSQEHLMVASLMQTLLEMKKLSFSFFFFFFLHLNFKKYALRKLLFKLNILFRKKIKHLSFMNASQVKIKIVLTNVKMSADITSTSMSMSLSFLRE